MADSNKETLIQFAKVAGFGIACLAAIITTAGVWNAVALGSISSFYGWVAAANIGIEAFGLYKLYKKLFSKKTKEDKKAE